MGKVVTNPSSRFYLDQYKVSGFMNQASMDIMQTTIDGRSFEDTGPAKVGSGEYDHKAALTAMFSGTATEIDEIIAALRGSDSDHYYGSMWGTAVEGSVAYEQIVKLETSPITGQTSQLVLINTTFPGAGPISRGLVLRNATVTGTGNGTGRNQGTTSATQTYQAIVRVISGTFTSFTLQIQQSSDDGSGDAYSLITGMTVTPNAAGVTRLTFTGATEAWKRASITAWNGTNAVILVTGGVVT